MKRDMDLVRKILLAVEDRPAGDQEPLPVSVQGYDQSTIIAHVQLLQEAGLLEAVVRMSRVGPLAGEPRRLTWHGHEFLENARNEGIWQQAKNLVIEKGGAVSFQVLSSILVDLAKKHFGL